MTRQGFSFPLPASKAPLSTIPQCGSCGLYLKCNSPKMAVAGLGKRKILIVGEAPGKNEDEKGVPFIGNAGQVLRETLNKFGVDADSDCWITNALRCWPHTKDGNRTPTENEIEWCRPNIVNAIKELQPEMMLLLGGVAVKSVLGWLWKEDVGKISRWDGWQIPSQKLNSWICPTWHPAALLHDGDKESGLRRLFFEKHIKAAVELEGRPWKGIPDWRKAVQVILDPEKAADAVREMMEENKVTAIDYECDGLKPDNKDLFIYSCSLSNGKKTVSFPWHGKVIDAVKEFLKSDIPKVIHNAKYEIRWTKAKLGTDIKNCVWDSMTTAHVLDNRQGICGLKFQSFVLLGMDSYDDHIKPYLRSDNSNSKNRIRETDLQSLLFYGGLDSLLTWKIAKIQAKQIGVRL